MLSIEDVTVHYGRSAAPALRNVSLAVDKGECVAIIGPSGSGKTTLFRAISGFVTVDVGRILVAGTEIGLLRGRSLRKTRRTIAIIAQQHDLVERLRVYHNVMAGALGRWSTAQALRFLIWP